MNFDDDPEDAYTASDPPTRRLHTTERFITALEGGPENDERPTGRFRARIGIADALIDRLRQTREIDPGTLRTLDMRLDQIRRQWLAT